jgi:hypothetical protein
MYAFATDEFHQVIPSILLANSSTNIGNDIHIIIIFSNVRAYAKTHKLINVPVWQAISTGFLP